MRKGKIDVSKQLLEAARPWWDKAGRPSNRNGRPATDVEGSGTIRLFGDPGPEVEGEITMPQSESTLRKLKPSFEASENPDPPQAAQANTSGSSTFVGVENADRMPDPSKKEDTERRLGHSHAEPAASNRPPAPYSAGATQEAVVQTDPGANMPGGSTPDAAGVLFIVALWRFLRNSRAFDLQNGSVNPDKNTMLRYVPRLLRLAWWSTVLYFQSPKDLQEMLRWMQLTGRMDQEAADRVGDCMISSGLSGPQLTRLSKKIWTAA